MRSLGNNLKQIHKQIQGNCVNNIRYLSIYKDNGQCHGHDYTAKAEFTKKIPSGDTKHRHVCNHCGFIYYSNPKIATGILCTYKDKILLTLRNIDPKKGYWCFPGGFLESGESPEDGAIREVWEECGVEIKLGSLIGVYSVPIVDQVMMYYRGYLNNDNFDLGMECQDAKLFNYDDIPWQDIAFDANKRSLKFWNLNKDNDAVECFTFREHVHLE